jgi:hypothetical protein
MVLAGGRIEGFKDNIGCIGGGWGGAAGKDSKSGNGSTGGVAFSHQSQWLSMASNSGCRRQSMVSGGGMIERIMGNVWVRQRWLGADGVSRGGMQRQGGRGRIVIF